MTTDKVTIDRELLADLLSLDREKRITAERHLYAMLANAPRQPEGDGLEVVATLEIGNYKDDESIYAELRKELTIAEVCEDDKLVRLSDAQRAIAELLEECERLRGLTPELPPRPPEGEGMPRYGLRWNGPQQPVAVPMADGYWTPWHLAEAECERLRKDAGAEMFLTLTGEITTLRQQLADSDAALRESRANDTAAMGQLADMRQQRDRLAELLRMVRQGGWYHPLEEREIAQIDAALAEVKPCPESPAPTT